MILTVREYYSFSSFLLGGLGVWRYAAVLDLSGLSFGESITS